MFFTNATIWLDFPAGILFENIRMKKIKTMSN